MATAKDFSRLIEINGVAQFILVRNDGSVVSGNFSDPISVASTIITAGQLCDSLSEDLNNKRYIHLCVERSNGENIFIFSLGTYYLGIMKHADSDPAMLSDAVLGFLKALS